jgi:hypothetical protein
MNAPLRQRFGRVPMAVAANSPLASHFCVAADAVSTYRLDAAVEEALRRVPGDTQPILKMCEAFFVTCRPIAAPLEVQEDVVSTPQPAVLLMPRSKPCRRKGFLSSRTWPTLHTLPTWSFFMAFPLKITNGTGSPIRAVAAVEA